MIKERHKIVPASYLVLIKDNKILLQRRFNTGYEDGKYSFVAGNVVEGETFRLELVRETLEEAGITIKEEDLIAVHIMCRNSHTPTNNERVDLFLTTEKWSGDIENKEPNKCDDLSWFELNNLPDNMIPYIRQAIGCIKDKIIYSEFGW